MLPLGELCEKTLPNRNVYDLFKDNEVILTKNVVKSVFSLYQIVSHVPDIALDRHSPFINVVPVLESGICSCIAAVFVFTPFVLL